MPQSDLIPSLIGRTHYTAVHITPPLAIADQQAAHASRMTAALGLMEMHGCLFKLCM